MIKNFVIFLALLFPGVGFCEGDSIASKLVSYKDCKDALEGRSPNFSFDFTVAEEAKYNKSKICTTWALATLIALQSAGAICTDTTYEVMQRTISYAYSELPYETGEKMVWSFAKVAMHMFPCEPETNTVKN